MSKNKYDLLSDKAVRSNLIKVRRLRQVAFIGTGAFGISALISMFVPAVPLSVILVLSITTGLLLVPFGVLSFKEGKLIKENIKRNENNKSKETELLKIAQSKEIQNEKSNDGVEYSIKHYEKLINRRNDLERAIVLMQKEYTQKRTTLDLLKIHYGDAIEPAKLYKHEEKLQEIEGEINFFTATLKVTNQSIEITKERLGNNVPSDALIQRNRNKKMQNNYKLKLDNLPKYNEEEKN